ncbi:putative holin or anitholin [Serratia phage Muldoon]|uniref:Putative holin or anitholin n=1 Tax=Serratia phage Muldoon TaxID=2601678 RepID=A0A5P8PH95_9CAUD|nr:putative holin or anitholin [Serratia phage Muldoon]QFR56077.1 putative holin or anitholin [Serratia phage Muldoon]
MIHHDPDFEEPTRQPHEAIEYQSTTGVWLTIIASFLLPPVTYFMTGFADHYLETGHWFLGGVLVLVASIMVLFCVVLFMVMISTGLWTEIFADIKRNNLEFASISKNLVRSSSNHVRKSTDEMVS